MIVIAEDSVRFAHSGPSHNLLRPAIAELVSCGPLPLPVSRPLKNYRKNVIFMHKIAFFFAYFYNILYL